MMVFRVTWLRITEAWLVPILGFPCPGRTSLWAESLPWLPRNWVTWEVEPTFSPPDWYLLICFDENLPFVLIGENYKMWKMWVSEYSSGPCLQPSLCRATSGLQKQKGDMAKKGTTHPVLVQSPPLQLVTLCASVSSRWSQRIPASKVCWKK